MNSRGFTLIELVMVIVLIGILAVFVSPRLGDITGSKAVAFADKLRADIRYAQNLAMTQNQRVRVDFASNSYNITIAGNPVADPSTGRNYPVALGVGDFSSISLTAIGFTGSYVEFNSLGIPYDGSGALNADKSVTVTGGSANQVITVSQQTGAVN